MLIGNGLIAGAFGEFRDDDSVIVLAAGVSNSKETDIDAYERELAMLHKYCESASRIVYFSTCSIYDLALGDSPYIEHKKRAEALVLSKGDENLVLRLPNVVGPSKNPHILFSFLVNCIRQGIRFDLYTRAKRYLLGIDEVSLICSNIIRSADASGIFNVCIQPAFTIREIVREIETQLEMQAIFTEVPTGHAYFVENESILPFIPEELKNNAPGERLASIIKTGLNTKEA